MRKLIFILLLVVGSVSTMCSAVPSEGANGGAGADDGQKPNEDGLTQNDVLSVRDGMYYLDGKKFAEIGFNKFELFWMLYDQVSQGNVLDENNPIVKSQDKALKELADNGFKTVRIFGLIHESNYKKFKPIFENETTREKIYFKALDKTIELLEKHNLRAVFSLGARVFVEDEAHGEHMRELIADTNSYSYKNLLNYLDIVIPRLKKSKAILMWEISNELTLQADIQPGTLIQNGKRQPTMPQLAQFYKNITAKIKSLDPLRMVTCGGSIIRESAYNLHYNKTWQKDTYPQHVSMYHMVYDDTDLDIVDIHYYTNPDPGYFLRGDGTTQKVLDLPLYVEIAKQVGKPLYVGEYGALAKARTDALYWRDGQESWFDSLDDQNPNAVKFVQRAADMLLNSGVMLTHWWAYQSDRPIDQGNQLRMDMSVERTPELFRIVVEANKKLKLKYGIQ